ncbi:MAG: ribonuclease P protein component [Gordonia sp. (in: high G+C Gram-positive bacteria)]
MTAASHRVLRGSEFSRTLKRGVRVSTRDLVIYVLVLPREWPDVANRRTDIATRGGPWLGLIVSKAVGSAVVRHRVARQLRVAFRDVVGHCPDQETSVVIRALPTSSGASTADLSAQLRDALLTKRVRRLAVPVSIASTTTSTRGGQ